MKVSKKSVIILIIWYSLLVISLITFLNYSLNNYKKTLWNYIENIEDKPPLHFLTKQQSLDIGWGLAQNEDEEKVSPSPNSSYIHFPFEKQEGVTRIGIFGGSYVLGGEVEPGQDFPSQLQKMFSEKGSKVEVINFGVAAYGVHQMYMLWKFVGCKYNLDVVIFVPFRGYIDSDSTFSYGEFYFPLKARYIMNHKEELELIRPIGSTRAETVEKYYRILQPWQYIRYDYKPIPAIRALLPKGRTINFNPLYHKPFSREKEIIKTYDLIMEDVAKNCNKFLLFGLDNIVDDIFKESKSKERMKNIFFLKDISYYLSGFEFAPETHLSAAGNKIRAEFLYSFLMGNRQPEISKISLKNLESKKSNFQKFPLKYSFDQYTDLVFCANGHPIAVLFESGSKMQVTKAESFIRIGSYPFFALFGSNLIKGNEEILITLKNKDAEMKIPILKIMPKIHEYYGEIHSLENPQLIHLGNQTINGIKCSINGEGNITCSATSKDEFTFGPIFMKGNAFGEKVLQPLAMEEIVHPIEGVKQKNVTYPAPAPIIHVRSEIGQNFIKEVVGSSGIITLEGRHLSGEKLQLPISRFEIIKNKIEPFSYIYSDLSFISS